MRLLHTMLRVGDLQRSIDFYTRILGMKVLRRHDYPEGKFTLAFVGYGLATLFREVSGWQQPEPDARLYRRLL